MNLLNLILNAKNVEIGVGRTLKVQKNTKSSTHIVITDFVIKNTFNIPLEAEIKIMFDGKLYATLNFEIENYKTDENKLVLHTNFDPPVYLYDQSTVNVFRLLDEDANLNWRSLSKGDKKGWLRMCLFQNGLPGKIQSGERIIDCSEIHHEVDFFCLLGEVLVGEKGYFGQDLDGFADCLIESYPGFVNDNKRKIVFLDFKKLEEVFSKNKDAKFITDKLKHNGFAIEIK